MIFDQRIHRSVARHWSITVDRCTHRSVARHRAITTTTTTTTTNILLAPLLQLLLLLLLLPIFLLLLLHYYYFYYYYYYYYHDYHYDHYYDYYYYYYYYYYYFSRMQLHLLLRITKHQLKFSICFVASRATPITMFKHQNLQCCHSRRQGKRILNRSNSGPRSACYARSTETSIQFVLESERVVVVKQHCNTTMLT